MRVCRNHRAGSWVRRALAASVIIAFTASCGSSSAPQDHSEAGSYTLETVNGQVPPVTISGTSLGILVVQGGLLQLTAPGADTYTAVIGGSASGSTPGPFLSDGGTYMRSGTTLTFHSSSEPISYSGTYDSTTGHVTISLPGAAVGLSGVIVLEFARGGLID